MEWFEYTSRVGLVFFTIVTIVQSKVDLTLRFEDKSFPLLIIYGRNVTCDHSPPRGQFPSQTWTCKNMRVNGLRMAYGYNPNLFGEHHECTETNGFDELAEVCRSMMREIGSDKNLWAAMVSNATCDYTKEDRVMLNMTQRGYRWDEMNGGGHGWIETLQCMAVQ